MSVFVDVSHMFFRNLYMNHDKISENYNFLMHLLLNNVLKFKNQFRIRNKNEYVLAFDSSSWRKKFYEENKTKFKEYENLTYKGNRKKDDNVDWEKVYAILNEMYIYLKNYSDFLCIKVENAEADDIIGVLTQEIKDNHIIISADKDFKQLCDDRVKLYDPIKDIFINDIDKDSFLKIHILIGDKSDNILACKRKLGEKTALKMLKDLNKLLAVDIEFRERCEFNKKLISLYDIPDNIKKNILKEYQNSIEVGKYNPNELIKFFQKYQLHQIYERIQEFGLYNNKILL